MKKRHEADIASEADQINAIRGADHFLATIFADRVYHKAPKCRTAREAFQCAGALKMLFLSQRDALIYAVAADGRATFLTRETLAKLGVK